MPKKTNKDILKKRLIEAMEKSLGVISKACEICKCSRQTYYDFMKEDKDFKKQIEDTKHVADAFVLTKFYENIDNNKSAEIIFYLKSQMGWCEKTKMDLTSNDEPINIPPVNWVTQKKLQNN